jgi:hypothetical protein
MANEEYKNREALIAEVEHLKAELAGETAKRTEAEERAHSMASASQFVASTAEE